jgi:hypothetical protein
MAFPPGLVRFAVPLGIGLILGWFAGYIRPAESASAGGASKEVIRISGVKSHARASVVQDDGFAPLPGVSTAPVGQKPDNLEAAFRSALLLEDSTDRLIRIREIVRTLALGDLPAAFEDARRLPESDQWQMLSAIGRRWAELDIKGALEFAAAKGRVGPYGGYNNILHGVVEKWASRSPDQAVTWVNELPPSRDRQQLVNTLMETLTRSDPRAALELAKASGAGMDGSWQVQNLFAEWTGRDREAALAALGTLGSGLNATAVRGIAGRFAQDDPVAAATWAKGLSDPLSRKQALQQVTAMWSDTDPASVLRWAATVEDDEVRESAVSQAITRMITKDSAAALAEIDRIPAGDKRDQMMITAANALGTQDARKALDLLGRIADTPAKNQAIARMCSVWAGSEPRAALEWFFENASPNRSDNSLGQMMGTWAQRSPTEAMSWVNSIQNQEKRDIALSSLASSIAPTDPKRAQELFASVSADGQAAIAQSLTYSMASRDLAGARAWAETLPPGRAQNTALAIVAQRMGGKDAAVAAQWLEKLPPGRGRDAAVVSFSNQVMYKDPEGAMAWALTISDEFDRYQRVVELGKRWVNLDGGQARKWIESSPSLTDDQRRRILEQ